MTAQDLKNSILQLAIQGKLVEQRVEEGTAKELVEQIKAEKEQLIKEKKIKKEKPLPEITEEEIPFEIPESWEWVRIGEVGFLQTGNTPSKTHLEYFGKFIPFISPGDILNGSINYDSQGLSEEGLKYGRVVEENSIMQVCIGGSIGKSAVNEKRVTFNQQINSITPYKIDVKYLYYLLKSDYFWDWYNSSQRGSSTIKHLYQEQFYNFSFFLPDLAHQEKVIKKIDDQFFKLDQVINYRKQIIEKLEEYKKSLIYEYVTGKREV